MPKIVGKSKRPLRVFRGECYSCRSIVEFNENEVSKEPDDGIYPGNYIGKCPKDGNNIVVFEKK